ncbi:MAG: hypothetical protein HQK77_09655 [Desulfobacterales bacterium]|nr:hypothetical protein [Desulfobacterales bacterium]
MNETFVCSKEQLESIEHLLTEELILLGAQHVALINLSGDLLIHVATGADKVINIRALAILTASNYGALRQLSKIIGEQDASLLHLRAENGSIHVTKISSDLLLITVLGKEVSIGYFRQKISMITSEIRSLIAV